LQQYKCPNPIVAGATLSASANSFVLPTIPRSIFVWASKKLASDMKMIESDASGFYFTKFQIALGNNTYYSTAVNAIQIYQQLCQKSGYNHSYQECVGIQKPAVNSANTTTTLTCGMVLRVPGESLIFDQSQTVGSPNGQNCTISFTLACVDKTYAGDVYVNIQVVDDGLVVLDTVNSTTTVMTNLLSEYEVKQIRKDNPKAIENMEVGGRIHSFGHHHKHKNVEHHRYHHRRGGAVDVPVNQLTAMDIYGGKLIEKKTIKSKLAKLLEQ